MSLNESLGARLAVEPQKLDQAKISPSKDDFVTTSSRQRPPGLNLYILLELSILHRNS